MAAVESTITIEELTGERRVVELRGPSLPFQGAAWGGEQRVVTTWYPGNATEATQQVLGPIEKDSDWSGVWRTTQMVRTPALYRDSGSTSVPIQRAHTLRDLLEEIFRGGAHLSVIWQNKDQRIARRGRAVDWEFAHERMDDIEWSITFVWSGRGNQQQRVSFRRENIVEALRTAVVAGSLLETIESNPVISSNRRQRNSATTFTLGQLENLAKAPLETTRSFFRKVQQINDRLKKLGELVLKVRSIPTQFANQALDQANNAVSITSNFIDEISRRPAETNSSKIKVSNLTRTASFFGDAITQSELLRRSARRIRTRVEGSQEKERTILGTHLARRTETLDSISIKYYGTPDHAATIAKSNLLPLETVSVPRGTVLIIPVIDPDKGFTTTNG